MESDKKGSYERCVDKEETVCLRKSGKTSWKKGFIKPMHIY